MGSDNFFAQDQSHLTDVESQVMERLNTRLNEEKSAIVDLEGLDDGLVGRLDAKTAELERLSKIFAIFWDSRARFQMMFEYSGVLNPLGEEIYVPGRITNGELVWFGHDVDDEMQLVLDGMKSIYDEIQPDLDVYNRRRREIRKHDDEVDAVRKELREIRKILSPNR